MCSTTFPIPEDDDNTEKAKELLAKLEEGLEEVQTKVGKMSGFMEELIQDNMEISKVTKEMIKGLGGSYGKEMYDLLVEVTNLRKFVKEELHVLRKDVDEWHEECHDVENFLFGLEQYYEALGIVDDGANVANAPTFLPKSVELRKHFVPYNADMEARSKLRRLRQTGGIPEYIKEFTTLMLKTEYLSDKDALFHFRDDLKDWAKIELDRRNIQTLDDAIATVKLLINLSFKEKKTCIDEGDRSEAKKDGNSKQGGKNGKALFANKGTTPEPCFLCNGPHWARDCPKKNKLSAMVANPYDEEEAPMKGSAQLSAIRYLSPMENDFSKEPQNGGWLYVDTMLNSKVALTILDTCTIENVMDPEEAKQLGLRITRRSDTEIKIISAKPMRNTG
ncbi:uncharacterized protein E5676_scaffold218G00660 [Cucumis melo var. makuwa]|uniref:Retrotransposon gag domain-containing protein n=1 Tax=Cucumis melo var. makuwa TaxID=1194695 RepID=A0A5D3BUR0_CUCMM|nr:uncharacterized protein E6C27_scaffold548G00940 [Cucumis melo var. makuwa]TYK02860.1 uncharacterized protein E5676_scaffold218G00660 [Cucumis melo var. makuwa]